MHLLSFAGKRFVQGDPHADLTRAKELRLSFVGLCPLVRTSEVVCVLCLSPLLSLCRPHTSGVVTSVAVFYATPLFPLASYYDSLPP